MSQSVVRSTPIVELYDQLHARGVGRERRLALARGFVAVPGALAALFGDSVRRLAGYQPSDEFFYDKERTAVAGPTVQHTHDLALRLRDAKNCPVEATDHPSLGEPPAGVREVSADRLGFDYIDRELVASRTTGGVEKEGTAVRLDLLLANAGDHTPIVGEVKIATDKDAFAALVQAMACAAHLVSPLQYERLRDHARRERSDLEVRESDGAPFVDLYLVFHAFPENTWLPELRDEAERLSALLLGEPAVNANIRRIACLLTDLDANGEVGVARRHFAFERPATVVASTG